MDRFRWLLGLVRFLSAWCVWIFIGIGLLLRLTVRDRIYPLGLVFYMTPIPALPLLIALATLLTPHRSKPVEIEGNATISRRWNWRRRSLMVSIALALWAIWTQYRLPIAANSAASTKILFWNVAHVQMGIPELGAAIRSHDASIVGLGESDRKFKTVADEWEREFVGYDIVHSDFGVMLAVKGKILAHQRHGLAYDSNCEQYDVRIGGSDVTILLTDISSSLIRSRAKAITTLKSIADSLSDRPVIIMGDFNTPDDSVWFDGLRPNFQNAFRTRGSGYAATWPLPVPVLTLDQVWTNDRVSVHRCWHGLSALSDHRPILFEAEFPAKQ